MTKKEIEDKLRIYGVERGSGKDYERRAKEIIFMDMPCREEYEARIKVITNYLGI